MKYLDSPPLNRIKTPDQVNAIPRPSQSDPAFNRYTPDGKLDEPATYYAWKGATASWFSNFVSEKKKAMNDCKELFQKLQDAISTAFIYVVGYERAIEAIDFSYKQIEKARNSMDEIVDEMNDQYTSIKTATDENMKENLELAKVLVEKKEKLEDFAQVLNDIADSVIELNEWWDNTPAPSLDFSH